MGFRPARERFAEMATKLKKAWILAGHAAGHVFEGRQGVVPNYGTWRAETLRKHISDLRADLDDTLGTLLADGKRVPRAGAVSWLAAQLDRWRESGRGNFTICTLQQFE